MARSTCSVEGCDCQTEARGLCCKHYARLRATGNPERTLVRSRDETQAFVERALRFDGDECLIWPFRRDSDGYAKAQFGGKRIFVHRLLSERVNGAAPTERHMTAHNCGNGHLGCANPRHLRWATPKENSADMVAHGTRLDGIRNPAAKLTEEQARAIRSYRGSMTNTALAESFGISVWTLYAIRSNRIWKCLETADAHS